MATGVVSDIVAKILEALSSQVFQGIQLACGVKNEIRELKSTLLTINAVLVHAEEQHTRNNFPVTIWLRKLKDVFYDADDLLDDFVTELKKREVITGNRITQEVRIFFSQSNQIAYNVEMARKIKAIRQRLDKIANDRKFHLDEKSTRIEREKTYSNLFAEHFIGRDDDQNEIIQLLLDSSCDENVCVIPIVGIGGLGKTALAQLVYNDDRVENHFDLRMWTCVSDDFNLERIVKGITAASDVKLRNLDVDQFCREINGKRYLLVLDDIWEENREKWHKLNSLLMKGKRGSKVLLTTRSLEVAMNTSKLSPYVLAGLTNDKSWSLFTKMAFENGIEPRESKLIKLGKCIVEKCGGFPLAIRTIGRLLYSNNSEEYWSDFMENEFSKIKQEESDILPTLKLSYDHLPSHLKQCFAYCALFPKDYEIRKDILINLWMAQGFLESSNTNKCLEDVGDDYFMNLVS